MTRTAADTARHARPAHPVSDIVARVAGKPVPASVVAERLTGLYAGPHAGRFPHHGREARQLRRWVGQLVIAETVCEVTAREAGLPPCPEPVLLDEVARVELGSLATAVLDSSPYARAVYRDLAAGCVIPESQAEEFYQRNRDLFLTPEALGRGGTATLPYSQVRGQVLHRLRDAATRRRFLRWLDARTAELVTPCPGWEHPGDPAQPDNTHRH